jgi:hypothetical protein
MKKWQVKKIEREDAIHGSCYTMQRKWLVKRTGKLYIKIWRLVEGSMLKAEKEERRKTANYAKVKRKKEKEREGEREGESSTPNSLGEKRKSTKKFRCVFYKFLLI